MLKNRLEKSILVFVLLVCMVFDSSLICLAQNVSTLPDVVPPTRDSLSDLKDAGGSLSSLGSSVPKSLSQYYTGSGQKQSYRVYKLSKIEEFFNSLLLKRQQQLKDTTPSNIMNPTEFNKLKEEEQKSRDKDGLKGIVAPSVSLAGQDTNKPDESIVKQLLDEKKERQELTNINVTGVKVRDRDSDKSLIEKLGRENVLLQFGYDILSQHVLNADMETNSRLLAPGDTLLLNFWGDAVDIMMSNGGEFKPAMPISINRDGAISLPGFGDLMIAGMSPDQARGAIEALLGQRYTNIGVDLSVQLAGSTPVYVMGEVESPGVKFVPASASVIDVLSIAGGIKKTGSLRNIKITSKSRRPLGTVDLYEFIRQGKTYSKALNKGDVIIVPPLKDVVAVSGAVLSSGIYEFKKGDTAESIVNMAGGFLPSVNPNSITIESFNLNNDTKYVDDYTAKTLSNLKLFNGDLITVSPASDELQNSITVSGNVKTPGIIQYKTNMNLSDVIKSPNDLLPGTNEEVVEVERQTGIGKNPVSFNLSLKKLIDGELDLKLKAKDKIKVFQDVVSPQFKVSGAVKNPGMFVVEPDLTIKDVIGKTGLLFPTDEMVVEVTKANGKIETIYLYELLTLNNTLRNSPVEAGDIVFFRRTKDFEKLKTVTVLGYVEKPGVYKIEDNTYFNDAIMMAGGLKPNSYLKGLIFVRRTIKEQQGQDLKVLINRVETDLLQTSLRLAYSTDDPTAVLALKSAYTSQRALVDNLKARQDEVYGRLLLNTTGNLNELLSTIDVKDGDIIYIPEKNNYVTVTGEVYNQTALLLDPSKDVKDYLREVGGMNTRADKKQAYIQKATGQIISYRQGRGRFFSAKLEPGDAIIVPSKVKPALNWMNVAQDISDILSKTASTLTPFAIIYQASQIK